MNLDNQLKILMICPQYYPLTGGYEKAADRIATKLTEIGHVVSVVTDMNGQKKMKTEIRNSYKIVRLNSIYYKNIHQVSFCLLLSIFLIKSLREYDIVHLHQHGFAGLVSLFISKIFRKPIILKITGTEKLGLKYWLNHIHFARITTKIYRKFDGYIATSKSMINELVELEISRQKIYHIPNSIDCSQYKPSLFNEKMQLKKNINLENKIIVLYVGRLDANKNPEMLLEVWKEIEVSEQNIHLIILGDGELLAYLKEKYIIPSVSFKGKTENTLEWYKASDIFVLPSTSEGFSNSLIEALSCGLAIVSTKVSGAIDVFENGEVGFLISIGNREELANSIMKLIKDTKLIYFYGSNSRLVAENNYDIGKVTSSIMQMYYSLVGNRQDN